MKIPIFLKSREGLFDATGIYTPVQTIVFKGTKINPSISATATFKGLKVVLNIRNDESIVSKQGIVKRDCSFSSPSTAAQFVTGRSVNGYVAWRTVEETNLKRYLGR